MSSRFLTGLLTALLASFASTAAVAATVTCASKAGERKSCPADTSAGVALIDAKGEGACLLGKTWVYGDKGAGFDTSHEYLLGMNVFWFKNRNIRSNVQVMSVDRSPANSTFGFYVGGQKGTTVTVATSLLF